MLPAHTHPPTAQFLATKLLTGKVSPFDGYSQAGYPAFGMTIGSAVETAPVIRNGLVFATALKGDKTACQFRDGGNILVSNVLGAQIRPGDEITFPLAIDSLGAGTELCIRKTFSPGRNHDLYQAP